MGDRERGPLIVTRPVILCIDDEDLGLEIRKIVLEREGFTVLTAKDGTAGLAMLDTEPIEAVILDFAMPGINGGQVAAIVRQRKPHMPILMLSAYVALPEDVMRVVTATATKGDGAFTLVEKLKELLQFNHASPRETGPAMTTEITPGVNR